MSKSGMSKALRLKGAFDQIFVEEKTNRETKVGNIPAIGGDRNILFILFKFFI
jgi:hypothetical protein